MADNKHPALFSIRIDYETRGNACNYILISTETGEGLMRFHTVKELEEFRKSLKACVDEIKENYDTNRLK